MKYLLRFRAEIPDDIAKACRWYEGRRTGLSRKFLRELRSTLTVLLLRQRHTRQANATYVQRGCIVFRMSYIFGLRARRWSFWR